MPSPAMRWTSRSLPDWRPALAVLPTLLAGACASPPEVEVRLLERVAQVEWVPPEELLVYPLEGIEAPDDLVRIARLRVEWKGSQDRGEALRRFFRRASLLGADSILEYREVGGPQGATDGSGAGTWAGGPRAFPFAAGLWLLLVVPAQVAGARGAATGIAARKIGTETRPRRQPPEPSRSPPK